MSYVSLSMLKSQAQLTQAFVSKEPNYMVMFVTAVCNARCPMCFYWEEIESANAKLELRLEEYEKISHGLNHLYYLSIGGGEPFVRKDLSQIVETFYKHSRTRVVSVATNGAYPDRVQKYIFYMSQYCPNIQMRIQVSIDNLYEKHDENRRVKGLFVKLLETCKVIEEMKELRRPLMLSIGTVLTPQNRNDLKDLRQFLDANVAYDDLSLIYPRGNAKDSTYKNVTLEEYRQAKTDFNSRQSHTGSFSRLYQAIDRQAKEGIERYLEKGSEGYPWTCVAGKKMITLTERGLLMPCEMLYQIKPNIDSNIGNVRDHNYDIMSMLNSEKSKELYNYIEKTHCSCSYECAALCNVVFHKRQWPKLVKNILKYE